MAEGVPMSLVIITAALLYSLGFVVSELETINHPSATAGHLNILVIGDWGRHGAFNQSRVALQMDKIGEKMGVDFVVSTGDNFYEDGLTGKEDPAFQDSFTHIYTLQTQWYTVLGNHDYRGDAEAQLSPFLRKLDPRWTCRRSYIADAEIAEIFLVDTTPFVEKYFTDPKDHTYDWRGIPSPTTYVRALLKDLDSALQRSTAKWKIVVGHHAIRSVGHHGDTVELNNQLLPILRSNNVDFYLNGHDHCLEHISDTNSPIQFLTSGAGSKAWRGDTEGVDKDDVKFFYDGQGFMSMQVNQWEVRIVFYDIDGQILHTWVTSQHHRQMA